MSTQAEMVSPGFTTQPLMMVVSGTSGPKVATARATQRAATAALAARIQSQAREDHAEVNAVLSVHGAETLAWERYAWALALVWVRATSYEKKTRRRREEDEKKAGAWGQGSRGERMGEQDERMG